MFWTGKVLEIKKALSLVVLFTSLSAVSLVLFGDTNVGTRTLGSVLMVPLTLSVRNIVPIVLWMLLLVVFVVGTALKSAD